FIKACKAIIDIVMFIIERGAQIIAFVNAVLDAVIAIAGGGAGGVPGLIEKALALSLPVLIGFLAALLGIGGLADKVKKLFQSLSKPVMKAVDWIVGKIAALAKKLWAKLKSKFGKDKDKNKQDKGKQETLEPVNLSFSMRGSSHTLKVIPGQAPRMASLEATIRDKLRNATASLEGRDPSTNAELDALIRISDLNDNLTNASRKLATKKTPDAQKDFEEAAQNLKAELESYASKFERQDIAKITAEVTVAQALKVATYVRPSEYSGAKHWRGRTDLQRQENSYKNNQFVGSLTESRVAELERETLLTGEVVKKSGGFHAFKAFSEQIGWEKGKKAYVLRAELTNVNEEGVPARGSIHSHPRLTKG
ncbi:MAG: hypothetical protein ACRDTE_27600, partial [Pseudonocardiaceae bacterium]